MNTLSFFQRKHLIGNFELKFNESVADSILFANDDPWDKIYAFLYLEKDELFISISKFDELGKISILTDTPIVELKEKLCSMAAKIQPMNIGIETAIEGFICKSAPLIAAFQIEKSNKLRGNLACSQ